MHNRTTLSRREFLASTSLALSAAVLPDNVFGAEAGAGYQPGCYTRPWDQWEYRVALDGIAEAGFKYAGLMTAKGKSWVVITVDSKAEEVQTIAQETKQRGLQILSIARQP